MVFGGLSSIVIFMLILLIKSPSEGALTLLFFGLGLLTSSQTLGYPLITENNPKELTGTAMGVAAVIIMGFPALIQPLSGKLLDWSWDGTLIDGTPFYAAGDFQLAFLIFPLGFLAALFALTRVRERPNGQLAPVTG